MPGNGRELFHKAHYNMLAKRIRELRQEYVGDSDDDEMHRCNELIVDLVNRLGDWFEQDNPRFERDRWQEACDNNE